MTDEYAQISGRQTRGDWELYFYIFMMVFWPTLLVSGLIAHFGFTEYDLRLPTLLLSVGAGWAGVRIYRARLERKSASH